MKPQSFVEISVEPGAGESKFKEKSADFFARCGVPGSEIVFFESPEGFRTAVYTRRKSLLQKTVKQFKKLESPDWRLQSKILTRKDWLDKWQTDYRMMPLGRKFMLVPFWQKKKFHAAAGRLPIYLDPKAAFGSGQHPSTQIVIALMEKIKGPLDDFLDLGTGTGILSVAAHRLGAKTILAYDLDPVARQAAAFNLKLNSAKDFSVRRENVVRLKSSRRYDLVCANLTASILAQAKHFLFSSIRKGGFLIISGILSAEIDSFAGSFTYPGFRRLELLKRRGWGGLLLKRG